MLSAEDNEILTRVGPGTPMGNLLRRYWIPACLSSEIGEPDGPPARVRLLGEDLVAFRDTRGAVGLIEERCPHRGASLFYGRNEECGLRCTYHGWKFDVSGQCTDQRSEIRSFAHRIKTEVLPGARVGRDRLGVPGPGGVDDAVPRLRHRRAVAAADRREQGDDLLQLGPVDGRRPGHRAHLQPAPVRRDRRHSRRRDRQAGLPVGVHVDEVLAARPARADRGRRDLARLQVRGAAGDAERVPARADQRLHLPRVDDHRADPVLDPADLRGAVR